MRKLVFFAMIVFIIFFTLPAVGETGQDEEYSDFQVIPDDAIRLRILANSNEVVDQEVKEAVRDEVNEEITTWVQDITQIDQARQLIQEKTPEIESIVARTLKTEGIDEDFDVEYNQHVSFPAKVYGSYVYPAGEYEAVLITIGEGKGSNWWCVLFPPLCFLDFGNGTSIDEEESDTNDISEEEETEVKFFLFEWLGWS